jgi:predicted PurR-regulated permease PerM
LASTNLTAALHTFAPQLKEAVRGLLAVSASVGLGVLQVLVSIVIAGFVLANSSQCAKFSHKLPVQFLDERGPQVEAMVEATIRSVTMGILALLSFKRY